MKKHITFLLLSFWVSLSQAQYAAQYLDSLFRQPGYFNGGLLVADQGKIIFQKSFGYADLKKHQVLTNDDAFQTASVSKIFTATAILQLVDLKSIRLDDPVQKYLIDFPFPSVTIRHLLTHSSGMPDVEIFEELVAKHPGYVIENKDLLTELTKKPAILHFTAGSRFEYCNTGYQLLALLVEKVSRRNFSDYLQEHIFRRAGMQHSWLRTSLSSIPVKNQTLWPAYTLIPTDVDSIPLNSGVRFTQGLYYDNHTLGNTYGDQNVVTTTRDLFLFVEAYLAGKLISHQLVKEALSPLVLNDGKVYQENNAALGGSGSSYGLGWEVRVSGQNIVAGHSGYNRGIYTQLYLEPEKNRMVILFDNTEGAFFLQKFLNALAVINGESPKDIDLRKPAVNYFGQKFMDSSLASALISLNEMRVDSIHYRFTPQDMNRLGYDLLRTGHHFEALETFKINVLLFPNDFNRYDSYGDALAEEGKTKEAILMYEKALSLNPASNDTRRKLDGLKNQR